MSEPEITIEHILLELECIATENASGATVTELVQSTGLSRDVVLKRLHIALGRGVLRVGRKAIASIDGRMNLIPCYQIVSREKRHQMKSTS